MENISCYVPQLAVLAANWSVSDILMDVIRWVGLLLILWARSAEEQITEASGEVTAYERGLGGIVLVP